MVTSSCDPLNLMTQTNSTYILFEFVYIWSNPNHSIQIQSGLDNMFMISNPYIQPIQKLNLFLVNIVKDFYVSA